MGRSFGSLDEPIRGKREHSLGQLLPFRARVNPAHPSLFDQADGDPDCAGRAVVLLAREAAAVAVELERFRHLSPHPAAIDHLLGLLVPEDRP